MLASPSTVTAEHLRRLAYLYVRQSSLQQVRDHREGTARQYDLKRRAQALGWAPEQIVVIDEDLGRSGASAAERSGFQRLVAEVGLGRVGLVMGLEVSRLARNSSDWHRLLEICALAETLILDEDGIYDPSHFNDRLLLGLKGTMREAELHVLRARLLGGSLNKARRGELWMRPPIGLVIDRAGRLTLDPDAQIQSTVRLLFDTFRRMGSALEVVRHFAREGILWPRRWSRGARAGEIVFAALDHSRVLGILHNPRYAGAFVYGIPSLAEHLRHAGWLTAPEIAVQLGVHPATAKRFAHEGVLRAQRADDGDQILFEPPTGPLPRAHAGKRLRDRRRYPQCASRVRKELQYEA